MSKLSPSWFHIQTTLFPFLETEVSPLDWADGEIPISWILTSASVHDSLLALTADRFAQTSAEIQGQTLDHANKGPF